MPIILLLHDMPCELLWQSVALQMIHNESTEKYNQ